MCRPNGSTPPPEGRHSRRVALSGLATVGLSLPLLAACADDGSATDAAGSGATDAVETTAGSAGRAGVVRTGDVPVGGGVVLPGDRVVVTQPRAGDFKCFSAVCTHSGCIVAGVGSTIVCDCHGSSFDIETGEVLGGPAPAPLPGVDFVINNDRVVLS